MNYIFYKKHENDTIWWVRVSGQKGLTLISFDKKKVFNLFQDYPYAFTKEQKELFDKENPFWADYFSDR